MEAQTKICPSCKRLLPLSDFSRRGKRTGYSCYCKPCAAKKVRDYFSAHAESCRAKNRAYCHAHPERGRKSILGRYGVIVEWYAAKLIEQGGGCGICGRRDSGCKGRNFYVDHDHHCLWKPNHGRKKACTQCVRGLLCHFCNSRLHPHIESKPRQLTPAEKKYLAKYAPACTKKPVENLTQYELFCAA